MKTPENWFQVFRLSPHDADFFRRVAHYSMLRLKYVIFQILRSPRAVEAATVGKSPSLTDADSNAKKIVYRCCRYPYLRANGTAAPPPGAFLRLGAGVCSGCKNKTGWKA